MLKIKLNLEQTLIKCDTLKGWKHMFVVSFSVNIYMLFIMMESF